MYTVKGGKISTLVQLQILFTFKVWICPSSCKSSFKWCVVLLELKSLWISLPRTCLYSKMCFIRHRCVSVKKYAHWLLRELQIVLRINLLFWFVKIYPIKHIFQNENMEAPCIIGSTSTSMGGGFVFPNPRVSFEKNNTWFKKCYNGRSWAEWSEDRRGVEGFGGFPSTLSSLVNLKLCRAKIIFFVYHSNSI